MSHDSRDSCIEVRIGEFGSITQGPAHEQQGHDLSGGAVLRRGVVRDGQQSHGIALVESDASYMLRVAGLARRILDVEQECGAALASESIH